MKIQNIFRLLCCTFFAALIFSGCSFNKIGSDVGHGLSTKTDTIGRNLMIGITDGLTDSVSKEKVARFLDSLIANVSASAGKDVSKLSDSIFSKKAIVWADSLVQAFTGNKVKLNVSEIQKSLIGKSKEDILEIKAAFSDLLKEILSDSTKGKIGEIRDELLGAKTDSALSRIVDHAMLTLTNRYKSDMAPEMKKDISFVSKHATSLLLTLGGIAAGIVFLVWWNKRKYLRMVALLTKHINDIPDKQIYDHVTSKIKDEAITTGLEPNLRKVLDNNGLLGKEAWEKKQSLNQHSQQQ